MKERGLLLTKDLRVKSTNGEKTQTRRAWKIQPPKSFCVGDVAAVTDGKTWAIARSNCSVNGPGAWPPGTESGIKPQYQVGDRLYLQEPYRVLNTPHSNKAIVHGYYGDDNIVFDVELSEAEADLWINRKFPYRKTSSRFMYKSLARTWFEVREVRAERLQDISREDAVAEGVIHEVCDHGHLEVCTAGCRPEPEYKFMTLWDSTNKIKWADNPWVFVYTYKPRMDTNRN